MNALEDLYSVANFFKDEVFSSSFSKTPTISCKSNIAKFVSCFSNQDVKSCSITTFNSVSSDLLFPSFSNNIPNKSNIEAKFMIHNCLHVRNDNQKSNTKSNADIRKAVPIE